MYFFAISGKIIICNYLKEAIILDENKNLHEQEASVNDSDLQKELEEIRDIFQKELDNAAEEKAKEETEEEVNEIPEEDLCLCCGEREKLEGMDYCEDCYEAMKRYPFKWSYFVFAAVVIAVFVFSVIKIGEMNSGFAYAVKGDQRAKEGLFREAVYNYDMARGELGRTDVRILPKNIVMKQALLMFRYGQHDILSIVVNNFEEWELNLPHAKPLRLAYEESQEMVATIQDIQDNVFGKYAEEFEKLDAGEIEPADLPYDEIIAEITKMQDGVLNIGIDENGEPITQPTTEHDHDHDHDHDEEGEEGHTHTVTLSTDEYNKRKTTYHNGVIQFYKYLVASVCERPYEERIKFLQATRDDDPTKYYLYGEYMVDEYLAEGKKKELLSLADEIYADAKGNFLSYYIRAMVAKQLDNDFDSALSYIDQTVEYTDHWEVFRQKALILLALGRYDEALTASKTAWESAQTFTTLDTYAFCALAAGNEDEFKSAEDWVKSYMGEDADAFGESVKALESGEKTVDEILKQGGYDIVD